MPELPFELIQLILVVCASTTIDEQPVFAASLQLVSRSTRFPLQPYLFGTLVVTAPYIYAGRTTFSPSCELFQHVARSPDALQRPFIQHIVFKEPRFSRHSWSTQISGGFTLADPRFWNVDMLEAYSEHVLRLVAGAVSPRTIVFTNLGRATRALKFPAAMLGAHSHLRHIVFSGVRSSYLAGLGTSVIPWVGRQIATGSDGKTFTLLLNIDWDVRTSNAVDAVHDTIRDLLELNNGPMIVVDLDRGSDGRRSASERLLTLLRQTVIKRDVDCGVFPTETRGRGDEGLLVVRWTEKLPSEFTARTTRLSSDIMVGTVVSIL